MTEITIENDNNLMFWIKIDGKISDLIMLSELKSLPDLSIKTRNAIDRIYDELRQQREEEE